MPIVPETKDWTFVLERTCEECGFDVRTFPREQVGDMVRANATKWRGLLAHPDVGRRPSDDRWSALEYACHVRDVCRLFEERLALMLARDAPAFANWDQDETAVAERRFLARSAAAGVPLVVLDIPLLLETGADSVVTVVDVPHQFNPLSVMRVDAGRPDVERPEALHQVVLLPGSRVPRPCRF